jgi:hypothetical protein
MRAVSAVAGTTQNLEGWRRPSLFGLTGAVLGGEILAAVVLWVAGIVLTIAGIAPLGGASQWVWLPWRIDGVWSLIGAIGWGYLVCSVVASFVGQSIARRGFERPPAAWLVIAIAISGYGAMAVGHTAGAHVFAAVVAGAVLTRLIAFRKDGSARRWPWTMSSRICVGAVLVALLLALSYSALHPFAADGSGITYAPPRLTAYVDVGLSESRFPVVVKSVTLTGPGASRVGVSSVGLHLDNPMELIPVPPRHLTGALQHFGYAWTPTRFPFRVPASQQLWITVRARQTVCGYTRLDTLKLRYTVLGIATSQTIPLQTPLTLRCR